MQAVQAQCSALEDNNPPLRTMNPLLRKLTALSRTTRVFTSQLIHAFDSRGYGLAESHSNVFCTLLQMPSLINDACLTEENAVRQQRNCTCTQSVYEDNQYWNFAVQDRDSEVTKLYTRFRETLIRRILIRQSKVKHLVNMNLLENLLIEFLKKKKKHFLLLRNFVPRSSNTYKLVTNYKVC